MKVKRTYVFALGLISISISLMNCKKDSSTNTTDANLYKMAKEISGFTWYKNSDALLSKSNLSGHTEPYLRTRYNTIATAMLDGNGKVQAAISFPEGSLIVKELYSNETTLAKYAILYKDSENSHADSDGWVWGYVENDGTVVEPSSNKGNACIGCHNHEGNINKTLMNIAIP